MPRLVIVADDLSGAADCGIACTQAGLRTLVTLGDRDAAPDTDVLCVDADTRSRTEREAVEQTERVIRRYAGPGRLLYKKLDSTLRGHVGAELAATLRVRRAHGAGFIVMAPAFPATGRTTVDGVQLLHGRPLAGTEVWQHETTPHPARITDMLQRAGLHVASIPLAEIRGRGLAKVIAAAQRQHDGVVCDAETEADLQAIADAAASLGPAALWAGSAGLARCIPKAAGLAQSAQPAVLPPAAGPILFAVGSLSSLAREQVDALRSESDIGCVTLPPSVLRAGRQDAGWMANQRALDIGLAAGKDMIVRLGRDDQVDHAEGLRLCRAMARMVAPYATQIGALVATGGETARAVLQAFGIDGLHLVGEVEPGVPLSIADAAQPLPVVTKAGAFGTRDTLTRCRMALRHGRPPSVEEPLRP